jgi:hypothetical protein
VTSESVRRITRAIEATFATSYLEVGVEKGATFFEIDCRLKHAVDPHFRFDPNDAPAGSGLYFPMTSDQYWSTLDRHTTFDVVFLDGLHTFEQTYRDFCAVLSHSTPNSVIILDDVVPDDVFSSLGNHGDAIRFREHLGLPGRGWHGDVYKVILALHDFHPTLDFRTILGPGNAQTLVWRSGRTPRSPRFDSLERISRCTWFELKDNEDALQGCSEDEAFEAMLSSMASA